MNLKEIEKLLNTHIKNIRITHIKEGLHQTLEITLNNHSVYKRTWYDGSSAEDRLMKDALVALIIEPIRNKEWKRRD